ncbi:SRPBCC family protein [Streptomyces sp. NRRL F-5123]|uniref:SRPBCC family protein n=1 Tax=Streptomyces sp. NRRL F-5123 TaxID=1463856 RepID=UPI00099BA46E|nr:SRPBCC family protein [Streptomyces sp. NRRL F-5123]
MAEHTRSSITIDAAPAAVMGVIADFDRYPEWTGEVKEAQVLARDAKGRAEQVRLLLDAGAIKDDHTLAYTWVSADEVHWSLVKSQMLRTLDGSYALVPLDGGRRTEVTYQLTVDVKIPMLGMIKRKAEKVIIDRALAGLKKRVESGEAGAGEAGAGAAGSGSAGSGAVGLGKGAAGTETAG